MIWVDAIAAKTGKPWATIQLSFPSTPTRDFPFALRFGSIPVPDPARFRHILGQLLAETGYRFIFCQGWSRLDDLPENPGLFTIASADHDWLFPHCHAAIIHGGIGTIAAALRAKLPLVIASIFADQPWRGKIIERRGLGAHLPFRRWTVPGLLTAIRATETPEVRRRVADIGEKMNHEDGLARTIAALESYFAVHAFSY